MSSLTTFSSARKGGQVGLGVGTGGGVAKPQEILAKTKRNDRVSISFKGKILRTDKNPWTEGQRHNRAFSIVQGFVGPSVAEA